MDWTERADRIEQGLAVLANHVAILKTDVEVLKTDVMALKTDTAVIKSNYATKADLLEARNSIVTWLISAILVAQLLPPLLKKFGV